MSSSGSNTPQGANVWMSHCFFAKIARKKTFWWLLPKVFPTIGWGAGKPITSLQAAFRAVFASCGESFWKPIAQASWHAFLYTKALVKRNKGEKHTL